jgi:hypothetical protein
MSKECIFSLTESADAKSFILEANMYENGVLIDDVVKGITLEFYDYSTQKLFNNFNKTLSNGKGTINLSDLTKTTYGATIITEGFFPDNVYKIKLTYLAETNQEFEYSGVTQFSYVAFTAISTGLVITNVLAYNFMRPYTSERVDIREQERLMNAIRYASYINDEVSVKNNLDNLKRIL